jgi:broad specificity phosphatase PhoE
MTELRLYVVRHAEPAYPRDALTPRGRRQAQALARRFARAGLTGLYSSPLGRALQTAGYLARATGLRCVVEPWTAELESWAIDQGPWEEAPAWEVFPAAVRGADPPLDSADWHLLAPWAHLGFRERFDEIARHSDDFLARHGFHREGPHYRVEPAAAEQRVAVVCHAGFALTWLAHLLAVPPPLVWTAFALAPASVTEVTLAAKEDGFATPRCGMLGGRVGEGGR